MTLDQAWHLLNRVGYGASPTELEVWADLSKTEAVSAIMSKDLAGVISSPPEWVNDSPFANGYAQSETVFAACITFETA